MSKIWKKNYELDELIEEFTVGRDYMLDRRLVGADCLASIAHARMLASIDLLEPDEAQALQRELVSIIGEFEQGGFPVERADEDCHTAIENRLISRLGEAGKKIHTGRSRNDQILAALRLYTRGYLLGLSEELLGLIAELTAFAEAHASVPMPGRTHMQPAMPSSVGLWASAFAEELQDDFSLLWSAYRLNDQSPLGSAASYGVPLPLDREMVASQLGFRQVQRNVLYVNNSRGKFDSIIVDALEQCALTYSKMAQDLILFSMPEFGYFSLPDELCTGSSIMPQKKNPDALELIRARAAGISAAGIQIKATIRSLPSGYNRDFQDTKEPFLRVLDTSTACMRIMRLTIQKLSVNRERLVAAFGPEIFATDAAYELVERGKSFREAYREIGLNLSALAKRDPQTAIGERRSTGTSGNLGLDAIRAHTAVLADEVEEERKRVETAEQAVAGRLVRIA